MNGFNSTGSGYSALQNAQLGINRGLTGLNRDAAVIAGASTGRESEEDVTAALVDQLEQRQLVRASARAMSIVDDALGTLLDERA